MTHKQYRNLSKESMSHIILCERALAFEKPPPSHSEFGAAGNAEWSLHRGFEIASFGRLSSTISGYAIFQGMMTKSHLHHGKRLRQEEKRCITSNS